MKKVKALIIILAISLASCDDFLEVSPRDLIVEDNAFSSLADLESGVIGAYNGVSGSNMIDISSRMGDDLRLGNGNRGQGRQTHDWLVVSTTSEPNGLWGNFYGMTSTINRVLSNTNRLVENGTVSEAEAASIKGELLALRAMAHFELWRIFSVATPTYSGNAAATADLAVPYVTLDDADGNGIPDGLDPNALPARLSHTDFFALLDQDLTDARSFLPEGGSEMFRFTQTSVIALQARVALYRQDFTAADNFASTVIDRVDMATITEFPSVWTDGSRAGLIFGVERIPGDGRVGTLFTDLNGDRFFQPANGALDIFDQANDVRYGAYFSEEGNTVNKYPGFGGEQGLNDIKIIRASEMYLIRAEARAETGNIAGAASDINAVRSNRIQGYTDETFGGQADALNAIMLERRKELMYEGHRFFDLKRRQMDLIRDSRDCGIGGIPCIIDAEDYRWILPVPQGEIFANDNMVQNDGYND